MYSCAKIIRHYDDLSTGLLFLFVRMVLSVIRDVFFIILGALEVLGYILGASVSMTVIIVKVCTSLTRL